jgi:hypothetical protein
MSSVIVLSRNDPHQLPGEPRKTGPSTQAGPAATRQNDAEGLLCRILVSVAALRRNFICWRRRLSATIVSAVFLRAGI